MSHGDSQVPPADNLLSGAAARGLVVHASEVSQNETSPLLGHQSAPQDPAPFQHPRRYFITALMCVLVIVVDVGVSIEVPGYTQILQDNVCRRLYGREFDSTSPLNCADGAVLKEVALLTSIKATLDAIPGILLALPFGLAADRVGRKPILLICLAGSLLSESWFRIVCLWWRVLPPRLIWLSPLGLMLGGGDAVATSTLFVVLADIYPQKDRANVFFLVAAGAMLAELLGNTIGASLTASGYPWASFLSSYVILVVGSIGVLFLPETLREDAPKLGWRQTLQAMGSRVRSFQPSKERIKQLATSARESTRFVWSNRSIALLMSTFLFGTLGLSTRSVLVLYAVEKYHVTIGVASFLLVIGVSANVCAFIVLPFISKIMIDHYKVSGPRSDFIISWWQIVLSIVGLLLVALGPSVWLLYAGTTIFGLGAGYLVAGRSLITSLVDQNHFATLYACIAVTTGVGAIVAGPMLAAAFAKGVDIQGLGLGLPFIVAAALYGLAFLAICFVKLPRTEVALEDTADD